MSSITLYLTNLNEFNQEFNRLPYPFPWYGRQTLNTLKEKIEEEGALDSFFIDIPSPSQYSVFELLHEQGSDVYYTFVTHVNNSSR